MIPSVNTFQDIPMEKEVFVFLFLLDQSLKLLLKFDPAFLFLKMETVKRY